MYLLSGMLNTVRAIEPASPERSGRRLTMSAEFLHFCELGETIDLVSRQELEHLPDTVISIQLRQRNRDVCTGRFGYQPAISAEQARSNADPAFDEPAAAELVHRARPGNVMASRMVERNGDRLVAIRRPAAGHPLACGTRDAIRAEAVVDAARQFATMICHEVHRQPMDTQFVLLGIDGEWPCGLRFPSYLRWAPTRPGRGRPRVELDILAGDPGAKPAGRIAFDYFTASPAAYRRIRAKEA
jgi:hypothetical protein